MVRCGGSRRRWGGGLSLRVGGPKGPVGKNEGEEEKGSRVGIEVIGLVEWGR